MKRKILCCHWLSLIRNCRKIAGEKERLQELQVFIQNLQIRTHLFANSGSNFYPITAYLPKELDFVVSGLQHIMDTVSEDEMAEYPCVVGNSVVYYDTGYKSSVNLKNEDILQDAGKNKR